jgi:hypothetical protein
VRIGRWRVGCATILLAIAVMILHAGTAGVASAQTTVRQSTGVFTLVQDGGETSARR